MLRMQKARWSYCLLQRERAVGNELLPNLKKSVRICTKLREGEGTRWQIPPWFSLPLEKETAECTFCGLMPSFTLHQQAFSSVPSRHLLALCGCGWHGANLAVEQRGGGDSSKSCQGWRRSRGLAMPSHLQHARPPPPALSKGETEPAPWTQMSLAMAALLPPLLG